MVRLLVVGAVVAVLAAGVVVAQNEEQVDNVSFRPPFDQFDGDGQRTIQNFNFGGSADVNANFIRLTPDRASKRGWVWAQSPLPSNQWTLTLRFRVSGQGKRLFGDGMALWFTQHQFHKDGPIHGFTDNYIGFGVLLDTFRNTEAGHVHKDVSLMINNGDPATDGSSNENSPGCDGDFRYWEGRDDFTVDNKSAVQISYNNGLVTVQLDAKNTGDWATCIQDVPLNLPAGWNNNAYLGLTATTGQLADNHDVLSILVSPKLNTVLPEHPVEDVPAALTTGNPQIDAVVASAVRREVVKLTEKLQHLHHHLEHQLSSVHDSLKHNVKKLQEQEADSVRRIEELEARLQDQVENTVEDSVNTVLDLTLDERVRALEAALQASVQHTVNTEIKGKVEQEVGDQVASAGRSWLVPFFVLVLVVGALSTFGYTKYRQMMKTHLL